MTIRATSAAISRNLSGLRAQEHVRRLGGFYRSPGSQGYHDAIDYVLSQLGESGVSVEVDEWPLDGVSEFCGERVPLAWEPGPASLRIVSPFEEDVVRWPECSSCLPWWCPPTPPGGVELDLVDVGAGTDDASYEGLDVAGKAVLVHDSGENSAWGEIVSRATGHGAAALVTNYLLYQFEGGRTRQTLRDAVQQLRLPSRRENPWVFTVSDDAFARLRDADRISGGTARVSLSISARTFEGVSRSVLATIPGELHGGEVWLVAHVSSATMPGANCAAGVGLLLELARAISAAVSNGELPSLRRSLRLLFAHEGYGTFHLAATRPELVQDALAAIAVCSVGHDQAMTSSSLVVSRSPDSLPTFMNELLESLTLEPSGELPWAYRPRTGNIPYVRWDVKPYTPWSDNKTWSGLGVPGALVMSLPDRYFHTQLLDVGKTDHRVFERSGAVIGTAAVAASCAGPADLDVLMQLVVARTEAHLSRVGCELIDDPAAAGEVPPLHHIRYLAERGIASLRSVLQVAEADRATAEEDVVRFTKRLRDGAAAWSSELEGRGAPKAGGAGMAICRTAGATRPHGIPGHTYADIVATVKRMNETDPGIVAESLYPIADTIWYATVDPVDVTELAENISLEFGLSVQPAVLLEFAQRLERAGVVTLLPSLEATLEKDASHAQ